MNEERDTLLGPALWIFGALLWAYVVLGELVVNVGFGENLAVPLALGVLAGTWYSAVRPDLDDNRVPRAFMKGGIALGLFVLCLLVVSLVLGSARRSQFEVVTMLLCVLGVVAFVWGRRLTARPEPRRGVEGFARVAPWFAWVVTGLATLIAMVSALAHA